MAKKKWSLSDLKNVLEYFGIQSGDTLLVHSSLLHIGKPDGVNMTEYPKQTIQLFRDYLGPTGTFCVPSAFFKYGSKSEPFNLQDSPVERLLGVLPNVFLNEKGCHRSSNPFFSVAAVGKYASEICDNHIGSPFGQGSPWATMYDLNAKMLFLGCGLEAMTFTRFVETHFGVPYLYNKLFNTPVINSGERLDVTITAPLRYRHLDSTYDMSTFHRSVEQSGFLKKVEIGKGFAYYWDMQTAYDICSDALRKDIHCFLKAVPNYDQQQLPLT
ncbi:AAC(3) family N-acetyltransferase [Terasakiella sp. SH-1]|uniref:AAC(3) family N-acetyltransferase n=1 Tax=Terasakiella sp. SH-1 TaxID=2560057 RepID=UPI0010746A0B|nr:AAC(3) family N-acetyltransferase [Terasakiella sp. SH-1]